MTQSLGVADRSLRPSSLLPAYVLFVIFGGTTLPSALYELYREIWGLNAGTIALIFASYVGTLFPTLIFIGPIVDSWSRRKTMIAGLLLAALGTAVFLLAKNATWLVVARIIQGASTGVAVGAATAAIMEWSKHPVSSKAAVQASLAMAIGSAFFPVEAGVLGEYGPWPRVTPYAVHLVAIAIALVWLIRSTDPPFDKGSSSKRIRRIGVAPSILLPFSIVACCTFLTFAAMAFVMSLVPSYAAILLGARSLVTGAIIIGVTQLLFVAGSVVCRAWNVKFGLATGLAAQTLGLAGILAAVPTSSIVMLLIATLLIGSGGGMGFTAQLKVLNVIAPVDSRAQTNSALYVALYLGFSLPALSLGYAINNLGYFNAFAWSTAFYLILALCAATLVPHLVVDRHADT